MYESHEGLSENVGPFFMLDEPFKQGDIKKSLGEILD